MTPLARALDDATVAVAGGWGITSTDLRKFEDAPAGDVDAIEGYLTAFRRADAAARGPLDERFRFYRNLDIWWSLVLRDEGEDEPPRRAVSLDGLPPCATSTAAIRACPTTNATGRASATSTGSSTASAGDGTCSRWCRSSRSLGGGRGTLVLVLPDRLQRVARTEGDPAMTDPTRAPSPLDSSAVRTASV